MPRGEGEPVSPEYVCSVNLNICRDLIRPAIVPFLEIIRDMERGKDVAVVRVPRRGGKNSS